MPRHFAAGALLVTALLIAGCAGEGTPGQLKPGTAGGHIAGLHLTSLDALSVEALRSRKYGSRLIVETQLGTESRDRYLASYQSDGLREYARVDLPAGAMPADGYPVVVFLHG